MDISNRMVDMELEIELIASGDMMIPLVATLHYAARDPYAVRLEFHVGTGEPNEWTFSRDLLAEGLMTWAGAGDIQIWPASGPVCDAKGPAGAESATGRGLVGLQLSSPAGMARFRVPAARVAAFLGRTYELVEAGRESAATDIEAELAELLRQG